MNPVRGLFPVFLRVSAFTLGGGLAMIPVMAAESQRRSWLPEAEFWDIFARAQALPGPIALNMALLLGLRIAGPGGAALAALGVLIPPVASILLLAALIGAIGDSPYLKDFLDGAYWTVPGLAVAMIVRMLSTGKWRWPALLSAALLAALMILFRAWAIPLFFGAVALWWAGRSLCRR